MEISGMLHGSKLLQLVNFPAAEVLGPGADEDSIKGLIERCGSVFIKPMLKMLWRPYRAGAATENDLETAAFTMFLYGRMLGCAAKIDDHMNRGRNMDTRTPASECRFVA